MSKFHFALALAAVLFSASVSSDALAATRNCTDAERNIANARLATIGADPTLKDQVLRWHLQFGPHEATGPTANEHLLVQGGYVMNHDSDLRTSLWASYRLTARDMINARGKDRVNCFRQDPRRGSAHTAVSSDYNEARYDQGHLANDADLKGDLVEQLNTYVLSNMSPQECRFNRGIWLSLEHLGRAWASRYDTIYITAGAVFDRNNDSVRDDDSDAVRMHSRNGQARVAVPSHYYRVIVRQEGNNIRSISFLLQHTNNPHGVRWGDVRPHTENAITTLAEIEHKAGVRLHPSLDRARLTESRRGEGWNMNEGKPNLESGCP